MIDSLEILNSSNNEIPESKHWQLDHYIGNGIKLNKTSSWGIYEFPQLSRVLLFSPIHFYFMGISYTGLIDAPSSYDVPTDFIAKVVWWHNFSDRKWAKIIEEASSNGPTRTLEEKHNYTELFEKERDWEAYAFMPIDLRTINSPDQYLIVFLSESTYVKDGLLCVMVQNTDTVSNPPPRLSILPSSNSTSINPSRLPQETTMEVKVESFSNIPYTIFFKNYSSQILNASITFTPSYVNIPASGWSTTQINIKANWYPSWDSHSITETIPIVAQTNRSLLEEGKYFSFENKDVNISRPAAASKIDSSSLTIAAFSWSDYIMNSLNILQTPVSVFVALAGVAGGYSCVVLKKRKIRKREID